MNSPNPVPGTPTPLDGQWNSAIVRQLLYAVLLLVATTAAKFFGLSAEVITKAGGELIDAVLGVLIVAVPLYLAYRARVTKPTPPIAGTPAVEATAVREQSISGKQGGHARVLLLGAMAVVLGLGLCTLPACVATRDAYKAAQHTTSAEAVEATAYVATEHYAGIVAEAAALKNAGTLTGAKLEAVRRADDATKPLFVGVPGGKPGLRQAVAAYKAVKSAENLQQLQTALDDAMVQLSKFIDAVKAGKVLR
jgi:hypothetical protein